MANTPGADHSAWEPSEVAAEGIVWMVRQPTTYSGAAGVHVRPAPARGHHGAADRPNRSPRRPRSSLYDGLVAATESYFEEPYPDDPKEGA